jgi:uncharacterized lipoprotein YmbA
MKRPNDSGAHAHEIGKDYRRDARPCTGGNLSERCGATFARRTVPRSVASFMAIAVCACLPGCFGFLKPAPDTARHFVLTPLPPTETADVAPSASRVGVGVVQVKIPAYLFNSSLAVRKGTNEIAYLPGTLWAERPDTGIPRVLTADLSSLLPRGQIRSSVALSEDGAMELGVTIEQFDVSSGGQAVLAAKWRILSPGGEKLLRSGESRLSRDGPAPDTDPSGAVATLSDLIADLSRQLAQALKETTPALADEQ